MAYPGSAVTVMRHTVKRFVPVDTDNKQSFLVLSSVTTTTVSWQKSLLSLIEIKFGDESFGDDSMEKPSNNTTDSDRPPV